MKTSHEKDKRGSTLVKTLSYLALVYAVAGWINEVWLQWSANPLLSHYSEYIAIGVFGIYRVIVERDPYTKKRIAALTAMVLCFWGLLPYFFAFGEPALGYLSGKAVWGQGLHLPMTLTFFLTIILVLLFGRRAVCSWNCPCVGARDTMGAVFRKETIKTGTAWRLRHLKWLLTSFYFALFIILLFPFPKAQLAVETFLGTVGVIYFSSFLFIPLTGNRNWCRWFCPYGQTFGILNKIGFYKITAEQEKCIACGKCTKECDMGIPVQQLVAAGGEVNIADCVGCGRCVTNCPTGALEFHDVRKLFTRTVPPDNSAVQGTAGGRRASAPAGFALVDQERTGVAVETGNEGVADIFRMKGRGKPSQVRDREGIPLNAEDSAHEGEKGSVAGLGGHYGR